jgi:hypothetical protein
LCDEDEARDMNDLQEAPNFQFQEPDGFDELMGLQGFRGAGGVDP